MTRENQDECNSETAKIDEKRKNDDVEINIEKQKKKWNH